ncbi:amino acid ABC transporter permease [Mesorhizobium sp. B2-6-1]|uniref:amino acid ABC transporter permease n=1 Tax=Mesorhizobium sp. B2-6-1 TaxID=2589916 RepID=UPI00112B90DE|nr:amino acid ABC transporter permease [Mesorhizobium sp. B2-6-1]TPJ57634.1 amino acid ABC transporter permease [Mesorhizobium sp. B2-6-1]
MNYEFDYSIILDEYYFRRLIGGIETTIMLFGISITGGLLLALGIVALRSSPCQFVSIPTKWFVEFQRNVPLLVHLLLWYFGIASLLPAVIIDFANRNSAEFVFGAITLTLYGAAFMSEDLRSGLRAIPQTQFESARSIGLSFLQTMRLVILPQAFRHALPPIISQSLSLFKNTSVAAAIGVGELMYRAREITTETFRVFEAFSVATAVYFTGSILIVSLGYVLTRWLRIPGQASQ